MQLEFNPFAQPFRERFGICLLDVVLTQIDPNHATSKLLREKNAFAFFLRRRPGQVIRE